MLKIVSGFVRWMEDRYGEYRPVARIEVCRYLKLVSPYFVSELKKILIRDYPSEGFVPAICEFQKARMEIEQKLFIDCDFVYEKQKDSRDTNN